MNKCIQELTHDLAPLLSLHASLGMPALFSLPVDKLPPSQGNFDIDSSQILPLRAPTTGKADRCFLWPQTEERGRGKKHSQERALNSDLPFWGKCQHSHTWHERQSHLGQLPCEPHGWNQRGTVIGKRWESSADMPTLMVFVLTSLKSISNSYPISSLLLCNYFQVWKEKNHSLP